MDQSRQGPPTPQTLQVNMHHLCCPCSTIVYPYYFPGYQPPILSQTPPLRGHSYFHHYQYTQFHVNSGYNVLLPQPITSTSQQNLNRPSTSTIDLPFGPPPRDRRNLHNQDFLEDAQSSINKDKIDSRHNLMQVSSPTIAQYLAQKNLQNIITNYTPIEVSAFTTETFTKYLGKGCLLGGMVAEKNEQRPCFKNILNLCNRTRGEVIKPDNTLSNIHSQGVPWATKDFIFIYLRVVNSWGMLNGYLGEQVGSLGKIDHEITSEFRDCYGNWEYATKQLTCHLINTFLKLNEANSSRNVLSISDRSNDNAPPIGQKEIATPLLENRESSRKTREEDESKNERRVYMKPGSYSVPKKDCSGACRCKDGSTLRDVQDDTNWKIAQSVTAKFIEQNISTPDGHFGVTNWLSNETNQFEYIEQNWLDDEKIVSRSMLDDVPIVNSVRDIDVALQYTATTDQDVWKQNKISPIKKPSARRQYANKWEYRSGGLTDLAQIVFDKILTEIKNVMLNFIMKMSNPLEIESNLDLGSISNKLKKRQYDYVNEIVYDFRYVFYIASIMSTDNSKRTFGNYIEIMQTKFEVLICSNFPNFDFSHVKVESIETLGHLVPKVRI